MSFYLRVFGVIGFLLTGIIVLEFTLVLDDYPPAIAVSAEAPKFGQLPQTTPPEDHVESMLARPLFSPSRRPAAAVSSASLPRLSGTLISPSDRLALFAGTAEHSPYLVLGQGDQLGGWTVQAIDAGSVTVSGPNGTQELRVNFDGVRAPDSIAGPPGGVLVRPLRTHNRKQQRLSPS